MATICMHHVRTCMAGLGENPDAKRTLLVAAGINPSLVTSMDKRIHTDQVARLFRNVQLALDDEYMGFSKHPCPVGAFKTMCELVKGQRTLKDLLQKAIEFYRLVNRDVELSLEVIKGSAVFSISHNEAHLDAEHFLREFLLVIWHRFSSWFIGEAIHLRETRFSFLRPVHHTELMVMFPGLLLYEQPCDQLVFDAQYLERPLIRTQAEVNYYVRSAPADVMTIPGGDNSLENQIKRLVELPGKACLVFPPLEEVAQSLDLGHQTLYRKLKASGTSYQKIKEDIRRETAIVGLVDERMSVEKISEKVGFSDARSFTRAFKQWTGMSPRAYKMQFHGVKLKKE